MPQRHAATRHAGCDTLAFAPRKPPAPPPATAGELRLAPRGAESGYASRVTLEAPLVSLIVATLGRVHEPGRLFASLALQHEVPFEVIVIDQNADDRLDALCAQYGERLAIVRLRCAPGLSRARNAGLAVARGAIVAFPDDDCRYPLRLLARVAASFAEVPALDGLTGRVPKVAGERAPARFHRRAHRLDARSVYVGGISCVIFLRTDLCRRIGGFDESLGLGAPTPWIAAEETDYLARAVAHGACIRFMPQIEVEHPGWRGPLTRTQIERGASYARAFGYVMRRHDAARTQLAWLVARPLAGAGCAWLTARGSHARYHLAVARGRMRGWREGSRDSVPVCGLTPGARGIS